MTVRKLDFVYRVVFIRPFAVHKCDKLASMHVYEKMRMARWRPAASSNCWTKPEAGRDGFAYCVCSCELLWPRWKVNWTNFHLSRTDLFICERHRIRTYIDWICRYSYLCRNDTNILFRPMSSVFGWVDLPHPSNLCYCMRITEKAWRWSHFNNKQQHWLSSNYFIP